MKAIDIVESAVPSFRHHWKTEISGAGKLACAPFNDGVTYYAHTICVRKQYRPLQEARFLHPFAPGHFSVAVKREHRRRHRRSTFVFSQRQNGSDTGADRTLTDNQFAFAFNQCRMANLDPSHIGDRIEFAGHAIKRNP